MLGYLHHEIMRVLALVKLPLTCQRQPHAPSQAVLKGKHAASQAVLKGKHAAYQGQLQ